MYALCSVFTTRKIAKPQEQFAHKNTDISQRWFRKGCRATHRKIVMWIKWEGDISYIYTPECKSTDHTQFSGVVISRSSVFWEVTKRGFMTCFLEPAWHIYPSHFFQQTFKFNMWTGQLKGSQAFLDTRALVLLINSNHVQLHLTLWAKLHTPVHSYNQHCSLNPMSWAALNILSAP